MKFRTRAIHVGSERDPQTGAVVPPIHVASTYVQPGAGQWGPFDYSRSGNPTRQRVARVLYPGLPTHPGHALAQRQMDGAFGAMLSLELQGDFASAQRVVESTRLFQLAVSLGVVESLIEQPAAMSHASYDPADRQRHGISDTLIRLSVGLEDLEDLQQDLERALSVVSC